MMSFKDKIKRIKTDIDYILDQNIKYKTPINKVVEDMFIVMQEMAEIIEDLVEDSALDYPPLPDKIEKK
jgi:hypothetical protein